MAAADYLRYSQMFMTNYKTAYVQRRPAAFAVHTGGRG